MAVVCYFAGSVEPYCGHFTAWMVAVRPERCPHRGGEHTSLLWCSYRRWVYTTTDQLRVRIERVHCRLCSVTDARLPSFLHLFRRYLLPLIKKAIILALDAGLWGEAPADGVGPYHAPAPSTIREWLWSFVLSTGWFLPWLQHTLPALSAVLLMFAVCNVNMPLIRERWSLVRCCLERRYPSSPRLPCATGWAVSPSAENSESLCRA